MVIAMWRVIVAELVILGAITGVFYARGQPHRLTSAPNVVVSTIKSPRCDDRHCITSIAFDDWDGHLYAIDGEAQQIVQISANGDEIPIAGAYYDVHGPDYEGACVRLDGRGPAARFCNASDLAFDPASDSFLVADTDNFALRRVSTTGHVSTIAFGDQKLCEHFVYSENHVCRLAAVAIDPQTSDIYALQGNAVMRIDRRAGVQVVAGADPLGWDLSGCSGEEGRGRSAVYCYLNSLAVSSQGSVIFVTEGLGDVVDRVLPSGESTLFTGRRSTYTGSAASRFVPALPGWLAFLTFHPCLMQDGAQAVGSFCEPSHLAIDNRTRTLYVADYRSIRAVRSSGAVTTLVAPTFTEECTSADGTSRQARICSPRSLAVDSRQRVLYILDYYSGIRRVTIQ